MTIAQQFLGKLLVDTEKIGILSEPYESWNQMNMTSAILLTTAYHSILEKARDQPWYGVRGGLPEEALDAIASTEFSEDEAKQFSWDEDSQRALELVETALQDPAFRTALDGLLIAYGQLADMQQLSQQGQQMKPIGRPEEDD